MAYTEGIPGTLIDAYCAGVPVVSALWLNYVGVFEDEVTGYIIQVNLVP